MKNEALPQGADILDSGVRYRIWAPRSSIVEVEITGVDSGPERVLPLTLDACGLFHGIDSHGRAGDEYKYRLAGGRQSYPDPASRWQRQGVHGPSTVIDPSDYRWRSDGWTAPRPRDLVIYELHVGAFTQEGTFLAAIEKLPFLRELGVTAIELMPVADFPGERNWGYDGVALYAPSRAYGHPDDLRALVDAAHGQGIAVILDVVYNHLGPDGNYLGVYSPFYFNPRHQTPWGAALNFDGEQCGPVRAFFIGNVLYWMNEFRIDGFRLDATHAIMDDSPQHIMEEIAGTVHERGRFVIAEDARNDSRLLVSPRENGYGLDGVWADDFHHILTVAFTGEREGYFRDYQGTLDELVDTLQHGWLYRGQYSASRKGKRGTECRHIAPYKFVIGVSNHDQVGNRAFGERFHQIVSPAQYRAASALFLAAPYTPLLFMGQEWATSSPFLFFTDHQDELGALVTEGRRKEFQGFAAFRSPAVREQIPDPQAPETFRKSRLNWKEVTQSDHAATLDLYKALIGLRRKSAAFRPHDRDHWRVEKLESGIGALRLEAPGEFWLVLFDLTGGHAGNLSGEWIANLPEGARWKVVLATNEKRFGGEGGVPYDAATGKYSFGQPEVLILSSRTGG